MIDFIIEEGTPDSMPGQKYPFDLMPVNTFFTFPIADRNKVSSRATWNKKTNGNEFVIRKINDTECRCYRIK